ncbi:SGNH/GDSL hydrolase family protein [Algoriphagus lutimaris]|uniref:SGNH/GDSL hydrolase family protein n=1 Tax=Algoriphagus lutimaris TaxID=613197 RepID=UPI00196B03FB|nr:SGNH/GDSL hydrolase family protein [Algoriphagus lutimaris]MBN3520095.1 SGNH/GDSL hydrolase family protein [Algoriphagus lutimaris]
MKAIRLFLFFYLLFFGQANCQEINPISNETKQVLFLGNSITYAGQYINYVETYYRLKHPDSSIEWINLGLPSETVSGLSEEGHARGAFPRPDLHERLSRVFNQLKPDLVFANYGMNDGIYKPLDDLRFQKYKDGINWLQQSISINGAKGVFLTPPIYDPAKGEAYANVLDNYSDWLLSKRYTDNWAVIDLHWPMRKFLEEKRKNNPSYYLAKDGIHPGPTGHWLMAREILFFLGETEISAYEEFNEAIENMPNSIELLELISNKQAIQRDAWLRSTGHLRSGLNEGLPMEDAQKKISELEKQIKSLLN